jgi:acetoacetate decarboxylase
VIPENLPEYVDRGGRQVWRPPYMARDTEVFGFVVECRREAIDRLLRRDLVEPSGGAVDYRCARERVAILFARIGRLASADHRDTLRGYVSELEVSVWCLAADVLAGGRLVWYLPYVFVDSGQAAASGREVYGYPKQMAAFEPRYPERLASAGKTTVKAQAIDRYDPDAKAVLRPMISATRSPGAGARRPAGIAGLVGHVMADLAVDRSLPYGERPRPSASITSVGAPPRGPARPAPAWAARRLLNTFFGRGLSDSPEALVAEMTASPMLVFLKQFRDVTCPRKACYQAIIEAPLAVHARQATFQELDASLYRIQVFDYASHPLARDIGVTARRQLEPDFAFHASFDFDIALGDEVWRATT